MKPVRSISALAAAWVFAAAVCPSVGSAQDAPAAAPNVIVEVRVEGNKFRSVSAVLADVKLHEGQAYSDKAVRADEQRLLKTRRYSQVSAVKTQTDKGVIVTFKVVERPAVESVVYQGNKALKDKDLRGSLSFGAGDPIDPYMIESGLQAIRSQHRSAGFYKAAVSYDKAELAKTGKLTYRIVEGPKAYLKKIRFKNNRAMSTRKLKGAIKSRRRIWPFTTGALDLETAERDVVDLRNFYHGEGYLGAQVGHELTFKGKAATLTFLIEEGIRSRIGKTTFAGATVFSAAEIDRHLKLTSGEFYNDLVLRRDREKIQALYGEIGYVDAAATVKTVYTAKPGLVDLAYTVAEGKQYRVGRIDIRGNTVTKMNVIRRQLQFRPGQLYDTVAAEQT
ncbi:hypothetical protein LCGC14_2235950, partial [marine sediment metagenome]